ncbi:hypothetical protein RintRC_5098 [Richelia intracellularis]|nr:hypothetical protein RintRC_5098 [Richelia intracellularis]
MVGIIYEMSLVDLFNQLFGTHPQEIISTGQVVKAMILNGLGFRLFIRNNLPMEVRCNVDEYKNRGKSFGVC